MRKRKTNYPPPKSQKRAAPAGSDESPERPNLATINLSAGAGQAGLRVGERVRIAASGLYSGQIGVIERLSTGPIPSALVRTEGGGTRQVRTIDLVPAKAEPPPKPEPAAAPKSEPAAPAKAEAAAPPKAEAAAPPKAEAAAPAKAEAVAAEAPAPD